MSQVPGWLSVFSSRLLRYEADESDEPTALADALERACCALHERLAPLISSLGFETLVRRSLQVGRRDHPILEAVTVEVDKRCTLIGLPAAIDGRSSHEVADAMTAVLAHFIWLLIVFIGENLSLRKVHEVWPEVPYDNLSDRTEMDQ